MPESVRRLRGSLALGVALCSFACPAFAELSLRPGESGSVEISADEPTTIRIPLSLGETVEVTVFSQDAALRVQHRESGSGELVEFANPIHGMPVTDVSLLKGAGDEAVHLLLSPARGATAASVEVSVAQAIPEDAHEENAMRAQAFERRARQLYAASDASRLHEVADAFGLAAQHWERSGKPFRRALALLMQSFATKELGDKPRTIELYRDALSQPTALDPWLYLSIALYSMDGGDRDEVADLLAAGLRRSEALEDLAARSALQSAEGLLHHIFGELDAARTRYERALESSRAANYLTQQAILANNIAGIHYVRGNLDRALRYFDEAIAAHERRGDRGSSGEVRYNKGSLLFRVGEMQRALPLLLDALEANVAHEPESEQVAYTTAKIGSALLYLGRYSQARNYLTEALRLHQSHESWNQYAGVLRALGRLERAEGRYERAIALHKDAISRYRDIERRRGEIRATLELAEDYLESGQAPQAATVADRALTLLPEHTDAVLIASARLHAGRAYHALERYSDAERILEQALEALDEDRYLELQSRIQAAIGRLRLDQGAFDEALRYARMAQRAVNDLRAKIPPADLRAEFFSAQLEPYDLEIEALMQSARATGKSSLAIAALTVAERASARTLHELVGPGFVRGASVDEAVGLQQSINAKLIATRDFSARDETAELARAERELQALLLRAHAEASPAESALVDADILALHRSLETDEALLRFWMTDAQLFWWRMSRAGIVFGRVAEVESLARAAASLHASLKSPGLRDREAERLLTNALSAALPGDERRVYVVADGILSLIPFQALLTGASQDDWPRELTYLPMATSLLAGKGDAAQPFETAVVVADPIYNHDDSRLPKTIRSILTAERRYVHSTQASLRRLPSTADEAESIRRRIGEAGTLVLAGSRASKSQLRGRELDADLLHFATHGLADAQLPELSSIVLSAVDADGRRQDPYLTLQEIYALSHTARLVVLSACDTHVGRNLRGEGVLGLSRGFMVSGAEGVVSTLWPVSDKATALFMDRFYEALLTGGGGPAAALAFAQHEMRNTPRYREPYFWAGFVLLGR